MIAGKIESISSGFQMANEAIKSGSALNKLNNLYKSGCMGLNPFKLKS